MIRIVFNNDASLFYKNHSLENERFLQKLLEKINTSIGWNSYSYQILDKNTYGWVEEVTNLECRNEEEIRAFYFRTGILVAVSYILGIGDLHYENMVAHGEYPILVDVETLFQNIDKDVYRWEIKENLFYSVLTSGLFPGGTIGANMSGITGGTGDFEREAAILLNDQTSEMRIGYTHPRIEPGKNRAFLNGKETIISSYEKEILYGFQYTYKWFMQNQDVVLEMVERRKYKLFSRYLSGGTQFFGGAINASTHPQLLCNQEGRREYLEFIVKGRKLCNFEKNAMLRGDIPYFFRRIGDKRLYTDKEISSVFFKMSIIEKLKVRLKKISIADCELQQKVLHLSVRIFGEKREWNNTLDEITDVVGFSNEYMDKSYVKKIADHLLDNMVCSKDKVLWLTVVVEDKMLCIKPADLYFYSGIAGIAVFWGKLSIDYPEYAKLCSNLDQMLFSYTDKVYNREIEPRTRYTGMYCGEGSIAYTVIALFQAEIADNIFSPIIIRMFYPGWHNSCIVII